eukprot:scaffold192678_cov16-Tisochrysis_lutea.AAC.1
MMLGGGCVAGVICKHVQQSPASEHSSATFRVCMCTQMRAESASEGVRALTQSTGKRVDEHAAAIQRLTL